jgi:Tfp pilus assembly protein PilN
MIRINLLKPGQKDFKESPAAAPMVEFKEKRSRPLFGLIPLLAILAVAALFFFQRSEINKERTLLAQAQEEKRSLQEVVVKLEELQQQRELLQRKIDLIVRLQAEQPRAVIILDELSRKLPEWVWLTEASFDGEIVILKGRTVNNNLLAEYIRNLQESPHFSVVNLIQTIQRRQRNDEFNEFSLSAQFVPPVPPETAGKPAAEGERQ